MQFSVLDLYTIGIGPSSSHTVGPMRAAAAFARKAMVFRPSRIQVELFGSLGLTGKGHGTHFAIVAGLRGKQPESVDPQSLVPAYEEVQKNGRLVLNGKRNITFLVAEDIRFNRREILPFHPNGMRFQVLSARGSVVLEEIAYSVGGGFVVTHEEAGKPAKAPQVPYPFSTAAELVRHCVREERPISTIIDGNEASRRKRSETNQRLDAVWRAMQECVEAGLHSDGVLPGGLKINRRAPALYRKLRDKPESAPRDSLTILDWVDVYAIAVNEENAAGGRVVTAPTNGAAGVIPAVMHYCDRFLNPSDKDWHRDFLLTAGAIGQMTLAVMTRASLGHSGRVLHADVATTTAYVLVFLGAAGRVASTWMPDPMTALYLSAALWTGGYLAFLARFAPMLVSPRSD